MKHLKLFEGFEPNLEIPINKFKKYLIKYCKENESKENESNVRAIELLDELIDKSNSDRNLEKLLSRWITNGSTLILRDDLLKKYTNYNGNGNTEQQLLDFNAFTLLDSARFNFGKTGWIHEEEPE